jgi:hypothetical protein
VVLRRADERETWNELAVYLDSFDEHRLRTDPKTVIAVEHLVDDEDLLRLRVAGEMVDAILVALIVAIAAGARFGREWR